LPPSRKSSRGGAKKSITSVSSRNHALPAPMLHTIIPWSRMRWLILSLICSSSCKCSAHARGASRSHSTRKTGACPLWGGAFTCGDEVTRKTKRFASYGRRAALLSHGRSLFCGTGIVLRRKLLLQRRKIAISVVLLGSSKQNLSLGKSFRPASPHTRRRQGRLDAGDKDQERTSRWRSYSLLLGQC